MSEHLVQRIVDEPTLNLNCAVPYSSRSFTNGYLAIKQKLQARNEYLAIKQLASLSLSLKSDL